MHFDQKERGFSFSGDGPLDMRMDPTSGISAKEVINSASEKELGTIFKEFGEERQWRKAAKAIVEARKKRVIETTKQLSEVIEKVIARAGKTHPATKIFQAIRIHVNRELESIEKSIKSAASVITPEGVIGVLTFHSLEDRIVKNVFRELSTPLKNLMGQKIEEEKFVNLTKKPIVPTRREISVNRRARSAKFRLAMRKGEAEE